MNDQKFIAGLEAAAGIVQDFAEDAAAYGYGDDFECLDRALKAIRAAIEQSQPQEVQPVACACKWEGDSCTSLCELHAAWHDAIHEWAERAKTAEKQLAALTAAGFASVEHLLAAWKGAQQSLANFRPVLNRIGVVGEVMGKEVIYRDSAIEMLDRAIAAAPAPKNK